MVPAIPWYRLLGVCYIGNDLLCVVFEGCFPGVRGNWSFTAHVLIRSFFFKDAFTSGGVHWLVQQTGLSDQIPGGVSDNVGSEWGPHKPHVSRDGRIGWQSKGKNNNNNNSSRNKKHHHS